MDAKVPSPARDTASPSRREPPHAVPHSPAEVSETLARLGVRPSRVLGQSFLADPFVADMEVALLELPEGSSVTEVGGGLGILTEALVRRRPRSLRVIEKDRRLAAHLAGLFGPPVEVVRADALDATFEPDRPVVGNLPFSVAAPILARLFDCRVPRIVALLQREVGERYSAPAGTRSYGRPALQAALYGTVERFAPVPASSFFPEPAVEGMIVRFTVGTGPPPVDSPTEFEALTRTLFAQRRKQLGNLLPRCLGGEGTAAAAAAAAGWPSEWSRLRPEQIPPALYFALSRELSRRRSASVARHPASASKGGDGRG